MQAGDSDVTILHNTILAQSRTSNGANSAIFIKPDQGPSSAGPVRIERNLLGGGNYVIYDRPDNSLRYAVQGVEFLHNRFVRGSYRYGPDDILDVTFVARGNVWDDDGGVVNL